MLFIGIIGLGLIGYGVWEQVRPREVVVEIIKKQGESDKVQVGGEVVVDVAGAVEKPGIYKLPTSSRIGDALVLAGGLAARADRVWVATNLNLAEKLEDGEKIFIPDKSANQQGSEAAGREISKVESKKININTASVAELDSLEGIGEARAQAIIANRPYSKIEELIVKSRIPQNVYDKIKDSISVY